MNRLIAALLCLFAAAAASADDAIARVNGVVIRAAQVEQAVRQMTAQGQQDTPQLREQIRDELIARELLVQEAVKAGLDKREDVCEQLELARTNLLVNTYLQSWAEKNPVAEDTLRKEYDALKAELQALDEFKTSHILLKDEKTARNVMARLKKGEKFDQLAKKLSEDAGTKDAGGDLGWVRSDASVVPEFLAALVKMGKGETSAEPVKTEFGFHVIRVDDKRKAQPPAFEQVRAELSQFMQRRAVEQMVRDLRSGAKIE